MPSGKEHIYMDWTLLNIQPTKDKKEITAAYRTQLAHTNPEDQPDEFKALRAAYEEAMQLAEQSEDVPVKDESPVGLWIEQVCALYNHFPNRIRAEKWKSLLSDDVCIALDKRPMTEEALLHFLMENFNLSQAVWQVLDEAFSWSERRDELYENYPRDFIDYAVIDGIRYPNSLPLDLFVPGENAADCDAYCRLYRRATQASGEELSSILEQMDALSEHHPYGEAEHYRLMSEQGDIEHSREGYRKLAEAYPNDITLVLDWAAQCMRADNWVECEKLMRHVLELSPKHQQAKRALAESLAKQGHYHEAKELIYTLMDDSGGNQKRVYELGLVLREWNEHLIEQRENRLKESPEDEENARELAWCYLQNERLDDAQHICDSLHVDDTNAYDYHNLCAKVYLSNNNYEVAMQHLQAVIDLLGEMQPDGTEKTEKRLKKLPEFVQLQGRCLMLLGRTDEAIELFNRGFELAPDDPEIVTNLGRILYSQKDYERATEIFRHLTALMPNAYHGYFLLAANLYELNRDRDAFDAINRALELDGSDLYVYILKMRILLRNGVWDGVHEILDFLHENGINNEINCDFCQAQLVEFEEKDAEKALDLYQALATRVESGEDLEKAEQLYFRIVVLLGAKRDCRVEEQRHELLDVLEKGLSHNPDDFDCLDYKAWLLKRDKQFDEALEIYQKLERSPRHSLSIERELAELYYRDLSINADKALHYYQILSDNEETAEYCFYMGTCRRYLDDLDGAEKEFLREQELDPKDIDGYKGLSIVYEYAKKYEQALEQVRKAMSLLDDSDNRTDYYLRLVRILRRLNRPQDAIRVVDELAAADKEYSPWNLKYDIFCQFGMWDDANALLKNWKRSHKEPDDRLYSAIKLEVLSDHADKAHSLLRKYKGRLSKDNYQQSVTDIAEICCDSDVLFPSWIQRVESSNDKSHALCNLAQLHCWYGDRNEAQKYAQEAIELLDDLILHNKRNAALYRSRRAVCFAILGRTEEAVAELAAVRNMPLCEGCSYCSCKDADIYEANFAEISGEYEKALKLYSAGREMWPDDQDFIAGINRMKKKGYTL